METRYKLVIYLVDPIIVKVVVVSSVKCRSRTRCQREKYLPRIISSGRIIIEPQPREHEPREGVCRANAYDIRIKRPDPIVIPDKAAFLIVYRCRKGIHRLPVDLCLGT